jgi:Carboxypeptidase regulatory-like domain
MRLRCIIAIIGVLFAAAGRVAAQSTFATLTGTVTDSSGAVVPGTAIEATLVETNYSYKCQSNESGVYVLDQLRNGSYVVHVSASGFKEFVAQGVHLDARDLRRLDVHLEVGELAASISVQAGATLIETETARITDSREGSVLAKLPMNLRSALSLSLQTAGVYSAQGGSINTYRFAGSRSAQQDFSMDGITLAARDSSPISSQMNYIESVQEVQVSMANSTAEFGALGQLSIISKSGGNRLSGSLFDYYYSSAFIARNPFTLSRISSVVHQPGGSLGGPVYLPKLYNGKDKTFFFFTYENTTGGGSPTTFRNTYAPASWRAGDFSSLATVVKDPTTGEAFPNNQIPPSRINPVTNKIQQEFFPLPNVGDPNAYGANNFYQVRYMPYNTAPMVTVRIDHRFSSKDFVFGRYSVTTRHGLSYNTNLPTISTPSFDQVNTKQIAGSWTHILTPSWVNEFRYGYAFTNEPRYGPLNGPEQVQSLGLAGLAPNLPNLPGMFSVNFSGLAITGLSQQAYCIQCFWNRIHQFQDHVNLVHGRHHVTFGGEVKRVTSITTMMSGSLYGSATFSSTYTNQPYADFLLGIPTTTGRAYPDIGTYPMWWHQQYFVTDDFKVTPHLTLNLGVRYEFTGGFKSMKDYVAAFDINTGKVVVPDDMVNKISPLMPRGYVDIMGASQAGYNNHYLINPDRNNFAPRVGLAYRPWGDTTVIRAGFGIFYDVTMQRLDASSPFTVSEPGFTNTYPNPTVVLPQVFPTSGTGGPSTVSLPVAIDRNMVLPYSLQYSFTVEHQHWNNSFRLSYIATSTRKELYEFNYNQPLPSTQPYVSKPRPYPQYPDINYMTNGASHNYNSLTAEVRRRLSSGLDYDFAWVWARDIGDLNILQLPENAYDRTRERGAIQDIPTHRITSHIIYELPFGKGKPVSSQNRVLQAIIGGWEITAVWDFYSGQFLTPLWTGPDPTGTRYTSSKTPATVTLRPNQLSNPNLPSGQRSVNQWFNPAAFAPPTAGYFGTAAPGVIIGPGSDVLNAGLGRDFHVFGERGRLRAQLQATNALNHPNWSAPGTNISTLGAVGVITSANGPGGLGSDGNASRLLQAGIRLNF